MENSSLPTPGAAAAAKEMYEALSTAYNEISYQQEINMVNGTGKNWQKLLDQINAARSSARIHKIN